MGLDLTGEPHNGLNYPVYTFNSDNPALRPVELVELWRRMISGVPTRVMLKTPGLVHVVHQADDLLPLAFGMLMASREEKEGHCVIIEGSVNQIQRRQVGDPVFSLSGRLDQKIQFLTNLYTVAPRDIECPFTLRYQDHDMVVDYAYELEGVRNGIRLARKP